jgi:hypothetical protein
MKYNQQFIYEDEFSDDEDLYKKAYDPELPLQTRIEPPVEDSELTYYEDEEELPLPSKDTVLNNYNTVPNPVTGITNEPPYYEDEGELDPGIMGGAQAPQDPQVPPVPAPEMQQAPPAAPVAGQVAPPYEDEPQLASPDMQSMEQPALPPQQAASYEDEGELDPGIMGGAPAPAPMDPNMAPPVDPAAMGPPPEQGADPAAMGAPPQDPAAMGTPVPGEEEDDTNMYDDAYQADPYGSSYSDEKSPETRVGNSSEVTGGRPVSVEDISRINELKKINSQLMRIRGLLEKELKLQYNKVEDKLNEAIEYFRIIISNLDSYVSQVDDIIMKYKRFIMTILTQINILKQQEINET